ncbi:MAG TPA: site-specific integrase [Terriglobales bacterium]|nr:site-specific integrase [Terriglobales bacterium]
MKRDSHQFGWLERCGDVWYLRWRTADGKKSPRKDGRIGTVYEYPTKASVERAAATLRSKLNLKTSPAESFRAVALRYMKEQAPTHHTTERQYRNIVNNHLLPKWGDLALRDIEPYEVEKWLDGLPLSGKMRSHIRSLLRLIFEFAMKVRLYPIQRNPMELVKVKGATKRVRPVKVLTYDQWVSVLSFIAHPATRIAAMLAMSIGIRREELAGLKWSDFDFANGLVKIQRAVIEGQVGPVKTENSEAVLPLDADLIPRLLDWRRRSFYQADDDWFLASPYSEGKMPYELQTLGRLYLVPAGVKAGVGRIGWHCFRHTHKSWLNAEGVPLGIQKDLMRHANISTTANVYGRGVLPAMREANSKVVKMVLQ